MPTCPNCNKHLKSWKSRDGIIDFCPSCKGQAVGMGVLRRLNVAPGLITTIWKKVMKLDTFGNRHCPHCSKTMSQISKSFDGKMMNLDICKMCQVFWFDLDEFRSLPRVDIDDIKPKDKPLSEKARLALARLKTDVKRSKKEEMDELSQMTGIEDIFLIIIRNFIKL